MRQALPAACAAFLAAAIPALAEDWPCWRGPRGDGTSLETGIPIRWSATENVRWKVPVPGKGHSSPIVCGERIFVTTCDEPKKQRLLLCLARGDGRLLWRRTVLTSPPEKKHDLNSCASSTPATDGRRVYATFLEWPAAKIHLACYDLDGKELWRASPGELQSRHGYCSSLLLYGDTVILNGDQDAVAYIVAFDRATGAERWRIDRPNRTRSYCPPVVYELAGKKQLVLSGSKCVTSYDPDTGKQRWIIDGPTEQFAASLVHTRGVLMMTGGWPSLHILGIDPSGSGNVTQTHVLWHVRKYPSYVPAPIAHEDWFFLVSDNGKASCLEARSGEYLWSEQLGRHHSASPVSAEGRLYFLADSGDCHVLRAAPKFERIAVNSLGERCFASPAVSGGWIFLRAERHLYCIAPPAAATPTRPGGTGTSAP